MDSQALQDRYASHHVCFGCGPSNPKGLRIKSRVQGDEVVAQWKAESHHQAFEGMVSGGIVGTLLDCHSNWTAAYHLMKARGEDSPPCTVTAEFHVKLNRPTPSDQPLTLTARPVEMLGDRARIEAKLEASGKICATCTGLFVAVKPGHPAYHRW